MLEAASINAFMELGLNLRGRLSNSHVLTSNYKSPPFHIVIRIHLISSRYHITFKFFAISFYFYRANVNVNVSIL